MTKYKIIGSYSTTNKSVEKSTDDCTITIPLKSSAGTLNYGLDHLIQKFKDNAIFPSEDGIDLLCLAILTYLADTQISREMHSQDSWTREIIITIPVYHLSKWNAAAATIQRMLNYLTGDIWNVMFVQKTDEIAPIPTLLTPPATFDAITLFSGGMDSLIEAINLLEKGKRIAFISHASDAYTKNSQRKLLAHFQEQYPENKPTYLDLWTIFDTNLIEDGGGENSTRSRSFLFIAFGICALSGISTASKLHVPENALIALNVPLDSLRIGSHSTRTTHPFYLDCWNLLLSILDMQLTIFNPYWNKTKGEMADECLNKDFLLHVIGDSISCSSPQKLRYKGASPQHCGYCVPCIIRRAAISKAFGILNDPTPYYYNSITTLRANHSLAEGVQLRSFEIAANRLSGAPQIAKTLIQKSGPLNENAEYQNELASAYSRGLAEVSTFVYQAIQAERQSHGES